MWKVLRDMQFITWLSGTHGVLSVDQHLGVSGHIILLFITLTGNERSIQFPSHLPDKLLDEPVSAVIVITTIVPCRQPGQAP